MSATLLVEIFTEELPPKALRRISEAFAASIYSGLADRGLLTKDADSVVFATPRRLAVTITKVLSRGTDAAISRKLMPVKVAYGADGLPTTALLKRLEKEGYAGGHAPADRIERRTEAGGVAQFHVGRRSHPDVVAQRQREVAGAAECDAGVLVQHTA